MIIGYFELYQASSFYIADDSVFGKGSLFPSQIAESYSMRVLFSVYLATLGLQRLTWYYSTDTSHNFSQWVCLLSTHVVEVVLWWVMANEQGLLGVNMYTMDLLDWPNLLYNMATLQTPAKAEHLFILFGFDPNPNPNP